MSLESSHPVTLWLAQLRDGDGVAAQNLWQKYYFQLVKVAQSKLPPAGLDHEVVAASAFKSFCLAAMDGRFPLLSDRHELWHLLISITAQKAVDHRRREFAKKRGRNVTIENADFDQILGREPSPEFAVMIIEEFEHLLDRLPNKQLRQIAVWKMEGLTQKEIADELDCSVRGIGYKLEYIRKLLSNGSSP